MARIFITGSTEGLGRAAAENLMGLGHQVVLHARSNDRASTIADLAARSAGVVVGDLASGAETRALADQVNAIGRMDAVIHNAVDPGWVRTRMGGAGAPVDLDTGQRTQAWLAVSDEPAATASGGYCRDMQPETPALEVLEVGFQDRLVARLAELTGVELP
jgi:NAD(P)-dependent dehydrogenase (short-subunit alcohol dehydrogenase family)